MTKLLLHFLRQEPKPTDNPAGFALPIDASPFADASAEEIVCCGDSRLGKVLGNLQFVVHDVLERGTINPRWPELEPLWRAAKSLRAVGDQLHEHLGVVFVAVFLCHELDGVKQDLQGR